MEAAQPCQQPVPVHGRVPVERAVEGRGQLVGLADVARRSEDVSDLVGILAMDGIQREAGEAGDGGLVEDVVSIDGVMGFHHRCTCSEADRRGEEEG